MVKIKHCEIHPAILAVLSEKQQEALKAVIENGIRPSKTITIVRQLEPDPRDGSGVYVYANHRQEESTFRIVYLPKFNRGDASSGFEKQGDRSETFSSIYDAFSPDEREYFVRHERYQILRENQEYAYAFLENIKGTDLRCWLREKKCARSKSPEKILRRFVRCIAGSIACLHRNHIVHRDIKAENFVVSGDESTPLLKMMNFDYLKFADERSEETLIIPEKQATTTGNIPNASERYAHDILLTGCLFYEIFTGKPLGEDALLDAVSIKCELQTVFDLPKKWAHLVALMVHPNKNKRPDAFTVLRELGYAEQLDLGDSCRAHSKEVFASLAQALDDWLGKKGTDYPQGVTLDNLVWEPGKTLLKFGNWDPACEEYVQSYLYDDKFSRITPEPHRDKDRFWRDVWQCAASSLSEFVRSFPKNFVATLENEFTRYLEEIEKYIDPDRKEECSLLVGAMFKEVEEDPDHAEIILLRYRECLEKIVQAAQKKEFTDRLALLFHEASLLVDKRQAEIKERFMACLENMPSGREMTSLLLRETVYRFENMEECWDNLLTRTENTDDCLIYLLSEKERKEGRLYWKEELLCHMEWEGLSGWEALRKMGNISGSLFLLIAKGNRGKFWPGAYTFFYERGEEIVSVAGEKIEQWQREKKWEESIALLTALNPAAKYAERKKTMPFLLEKLGSPGFYEELWGLLCSQLGPFDPQNDANSLWKGRKHLAITSPRSLSEPLAIETFRHREQWLSYNARRLFCTDLLDKKWVLFVLTKWLPRFIDLWFSLYQNLRHTNERGSCVKIIEDNLLIQEIKGTYSRLIQEVQKSGVSYVLALAFFEDIHAEIYLEHANPVYAVIHRPYLPLKGKEALESLDPAKDIHFLILQGIRILERNVYHPVDFQVLRRDYDSVQKTLQKLDIAEKKIKNCLGLPWNKPFPQDACELERQKNEVSADFYETYGSDREELFDRLIEDEQWEITETLLRLLGCESLMCRSNAPNDFDLEEEGKERLSETDGSENFLLESEPEKDEAGSPSLFFQGSAELEPLTASEFAPLTTAELAPLTTAELAPLTTAELAPLTTAELAPLTEKEASGIGHPEDAYPENEPTDARPSSEESPEEIPVSKKNPAVTTEESDALLHLLRKEMRFLLYALFFSAISIGIMRFCCNYFQPLRAIWENIIEKTQFFNFF